MAKLDNFRLVLAETLHESNRDPARIKRGENDSLPGIIAWYTQGMRIIVSHTSALEFWCSTLSDSGSARERCRICKLPATGPFAQDIRNHPLVSGGILSLPVNVLSLESRKNSATLTIHRTQPLPEESLRAVMLPQLDEPLFVTSPELTLVHMASLLSFPRAVHLGYKFCGTFAPDKRQPYGVRSRKPLTSPERMRSYLDKTAHIRGVKAARSILPYILGNSASPRESTLSELLTLPYARGGSKIERPAMNGTVPLPTRHD